MMMGLEALGMRVGLWEERAKPQAVGNIRERNPAATENQGIAAAQKKKGGPTRLESTRLVGFYSTSFLSLTGEGSFYLACS